MKVMISGGFDPLHTGHLDLIREAKQFGEVVVALNSDSWLEKKKGYCLLPWNERRQILEAVGVAVAKFDDSDGTAVSALRSFEPDVFANGGDRVLSNTPEVDFCLEHGIYLLFGIGGEKSASSSRLFEKAASEWAARNYVPAAKFKADEMTVSTKDRAAAGEVVFTPWGWHRILDQSETHWVKELYIHRSHRTSLQRHKERDELFFVLSGKAKVTIGERLIVLSRGDGYKVGREVSHRLEGDSDVHLIEIAHGFPREDDIERIADDYGRA